ncbi:hypothetical protein QFC22_005567 [Naganishia vaughanmartiniae]|uniref:Uncharacterized protein n=1 Tax=Naganishia vaughanmartiniae TaxID=1424756 RepID=A0ACC2WUA0_9TREE|nr:hypothetical protein QFC22_005567 [Naganishia vaughanmartiniae]
METAEHLQDLLSKAQYDQALDLVNQSSIENKQELVSYVNQLKFSQLPPASYTRDSLRTSLELIGDDAWVVEACAAVVMEDISVAEETVRIGLERTNGAKTWLQERLSDETGSAAQQETEDEWARINQQLQNAETQRRMLDLRSTFLETRQKLVVYRDLYGSTTQSTTSQDDADPDVIEIDDPWADSETASTMNMDTSSDEPTACPPIPLSTFLSSSIPCIAITLAAYGHTAPLSQLYKQCLDQLYPYRYAILDALPSYISPQQVDGILPVIDGTTGQEKAIPITVPPLDGLSVDHFDALLLQQLGQSRNLPDYPSYPAPRDATQVSQWYQHRIERIQAELLIDLALEWCQVAVANGADELQDTGRELGFLERLVYDAGQGVQTYTLDAWRRLDDYQRVQAYLSASSVTSLATDIRRLVFPYLESVKAADKRNADIKRRILQRYTLEAPLEKSLAIFEASKATLPVQERIIDNDVDVARLALARLYGDDSFDKWEIKSRIFECLPVWDVAGDELDEETSQEVTATTLESLASFIQPSTTRAAPGPTDLLLFFEPLPFVALSRALDILDIHLESGEILAKWGVPAPLRTFLQTAFDREEQRRWAVRAARQAGGGFEDEDEWVSLMDDMIKLSGGGDGLLKGAFGLLGKDEVLKIFFSGVLSSGHFDLAKRLLNGSEIDTPLGPGTVESLVLDASREFYDNSTSGNMHTDGMKMAYDCLAVAPPTQAIRREREFIEATSRITSFGVKSQRGDAISPLEIRLTKNRLDLVALVLSTSEDAYLHVEVILDLANKLGYRGDNVAEVQVLGMLAEAAMQVPDFEPAADICDRMIRLVDETGKRQRQNAKNGSLASVESVKDVCWKTCYQLGKQSEFTDLSKRMKFLAKALEYCPAEMITEMLAVWRKLEDGHIRLEEAAKHRRDARIPEPEGSTRGHRRTGSATSTSSADGLRGRTTAEQQLLGSRTAARAAKTFNKVAHDITARGFALPSLATPHFSRPASAQSRSRPDQSPARSETGSVNTLALRDQLSGLGDGGEIKQQARKALVKGVGWLLGANENEMKDMGR